MDSPVSTATARNADNQPWLKREDWAAGEIKPGDKNAAFMSWIIALVLCGVSIPMMFDLPQELHEGHKVVLLSLLFPMAGICLLVSAVYGTLRRLKYRDVVFRMGAVPGVIDGTLNGTIEVPGHFSPRAGVHLCLQCVRRHTTRLDSNNSERVAVEDVIWKDEKTLGGDLPQTGPGKYQLPVFFKIPSDCRPTNHSDHDDEILWRLIATSPQPGLDFRAVFEVPVFKTELSGRESILTADATAKYEVPFDALRETAAARIKIRELADGSKVFLLPALRSFREKIGVSVVWLFMTFWTFMMFFLVFSQGVPDEFPLPGVIRRAIQFVIVNYATPVLLLFGLIALFMALACLDAWLRSSRIVATPRQLQVVTHWLFLKRTVAIRPAEIIEIKSSNTTTVNGVRYFDLIVRARDHESGWFAREFLARARPANASNEADPKARETDDREITAATGIKGEHEAEWLLSQLRMALGVSC